MNQMMMNESAIALPMNHTQRWYIVHYVVERVKSGMWRGIQAAEEKEGGTPDTMKEVEIFGKIEKSEVNTGNIRCDSRR
ncbi:hypothetical protein [Duncaniella muris]|uniref:hypothetical protein n=1 Tax=Duncaniella muris TaxID=2094150 RepID=UPI003F67A665